MAKVQFTVDEFPARKTFNQDNIEEFSDFKAGLAYEIRLNGMPVEDMEKLGYGNIVATFVRMSVNGKSMGKFNHSINCLRNQPGQKEEWINKLWMVYSEYSTGFYILSMVPLTASEKEKIMEGFVDFIYKNVFVTDKWKMAWVAFEKLMGEKLVEEEQMDECLDAIESEFLIKEDYFGYSEWIMSSEDKFWRDCDDIVDFWSEVEEFLEFEWFVFEVSKMDAIEIGEEANSNLPDDDANNNLILNDANFPKLGSTASPNNLAISCH